MDEYKTSDTNLLEVDNKGFKTKIENNKIKESGENNDNWSQRESLKTPSIGA